MKELWQVVDEKVLYDKGIVKFREKECYHIKKGIEHVFFRMEFLDWVNIVPITPDNQVILVKQYRFGTEKITLEIPGGTLDQGENKAIAAANRELLEETGYQGERLVSLGKVAVNPAIQDNYCHFYLAQNVTKIQEQHLDSTEDIEVQLVSWEKVDELIANKEIEHSLAVLALLYAQRYLKNN